MKSIKIPIILIGLLINFLPFFVQAATGGPLIPCGTEANPQPCTLACFFVMIEMIINFLLLYISIPLVTTGFLVAGIYLIFGSSEQTVARGKAILKYTLIGTVLAFAAFLIIDQILYELTGSHSWSQTPGGC